MPSRSNKLKILLTGGGTGGHIYPLVAVAKKLRKQGIERGFDVDLRYFGDPEEFRFYLENNDIRISPIASSKWRRYSSIQNFFDIFRFFFGTIQSMWKVFWFMPHICFSKGGPGALSVIVACRFYFVPLLIHESDAVPGLTNRLSAKAAKIIELSFESAKKYVNPKKTHLVGNPVREEVLKAEPAPISKAEFGFDPKQPVVLVLGGSQGAVRINNFIFKNLPRLTQAFQILHQVGSHNFEEYKKDYDFLYEKNDNLRNRYNFQPYFEQNIGKAYEAADAVLSRAGAGLIFEIAAVGKPSVLVPLPESAYAHQVRNAYEYQRAGGGVVIEEENLLPGVIIDAIEKILNDREIYRKMSEAAKKFYVPDSAKLIADDIFNILGV